MHVFRAQSVCLLTVVQCEQQATIQGLKTAFVLAAWFTLPQLFPRQQMWLPLFAWHALTGLLRDVESVC